MKRCFMVTQKGSEVTRGFGFVQFAAVEDAKRAIELKNASAVAGRKIRVKLAMHRLPRDHRQQMADKVSLEDTKGNNDAVDLPTGVKNHNETPLTPSSQKENPQAPETSKPATGTCQVMLPDSVSTDKPSGSESKGLLEQ